MQQQTHDDKITTISPSAKDHAITFVITIALLMCPVLILVMLPQDWKNAGAQFLMEKIVISHPGIFLLGVIFITLLLEIVVVIIPLPYPLQQSLISLSRMLNTILWVAAGIMLFLWIILQSYDAYASSVDLLRSNELSLILTKTGRQHIFNLREDYKNLAETAQQTMSIQEADEKYYKYLWRYVADKLELGEQFPRLDIRPMAWLLTLGYESRKLWGLIAESFLPYHEGIKQTLAQIRTKKTTIINSPSS